MAARWSEVEGNELILILFTTTAPDPLTDELSHQGHTVYEALAVSEVYALAHQHPLATIIMTADVDPERAKTIQHHLPHSAPETSDHCA